MATPITNAMVALPTDLTMFQLAEFATVTPLTVMLLAPRWPGIDGDARNPDDYLGLDWDRRSTAVLATPNAAQAKNKLRMKAPRDIKHPHDMCRRE